MLVVTLKKILRIVMMTMTTNKLFFFTSKTHFFTLLFFTNTCISRCMLPAPLFWFRIQNGPNSLYFISTWLYTSFFICTPLTFLNLHGREGVGDMLSPFSDFGFKNGLNCLYYVSTWLYTSFFICTLLTFLPLPEGAGDMLSPPFLILHSKMAQLFVFC